MTAVYYRRPTPYAARFGHLPAQQRDFAAAEARRGLGGILNALHGVLYVNHPYAVPQADFKPVQLQRFAEVGLQIPPTLVANDVQAARKFAADHEHIIYKTFRGLPRSEDGHIGAIWAQRVEPDDFDGSVAVTAHLFQAEIPKTGDVRVTVVGRRVFAFALTGDGDAPEHWTAIECNPNGQWGWLPDAQAITNAFADILSRKETAGHDRAR